VITVITAGVMPLETSVYLKRASTDALYEIFQKYASHTKKNGEIFLTSEDFIRKFLGLYPEDNFNSKSVDILAGVVDTSKDGLISFPEFTAFEAVLCGPDALYRTAFQLFDIGGTGLITFDEFANVVKQTVLHEKVPFDLDGDFVKLYFGRNKERVVTYVEFSQFLHDFHGERAKQAFKKYDTNGQGFIAALDFHDIMSNVKSHLLTPIVKANLVAAVSSTGGFTVTYPFFIAFNHLLSSMELIKRIFLNATNNDRTAEVTKEEFLRSAQMMSGITPMEISILFTLADLIHHSGGTEDRSLGTPHTLGRLSYSDIEAMAPEQYLKAKQFKLAEVKMVQVITILQLVACDLR
jgi:solute carrier family 25 aspartate/glutamate transporter 12/13